jgi:hypothetical protein
MGTSTRWPNAVWVDLPIGIARAILCDRLLREVQFASAWRIAGAKGDGFSRRLGIDKSMKMYKIHATGA